MQDLGVKLDNFWQMCVLLFNHYLTQDIKNFIMTEHIFCLFV